MFVYFFFISIYFLTTNCQALSPCVPLTPLPLALNHEGHGHETNSPTPMPPCLPPASNETTAETTTVTATTAEEKTLTIYASSTPSLFATHIFFIVIFFKL